MRSTVPNTRTRPVWQNGQAIVLIALLILVLFGMLGLAVDSGRAYVDRRDQQAAVDAAALAAGDWYDNFNDVAGKSVPNSVQVYANDLRLYGGLPTPAHPATVYVGVNNSLPQDYWKYTWSSGYTLEVLATNTLFNGYQFLYTSSHNMPLAFMQIFGGSPTIQIQAQAGSIVRNQRQNPAILTLSTGSCSLNLKGGATLTVLGDTYSNGTACVTGSLQEAGNCYGAAGSSCSSASFYCYNATSGVPPYPPVCKPGDIQGQAVVPAPTLPDPGYLAPSVGYYTNPQGYSQWNRGTWTEMYPGQYGAFHLTGGSASCAFLDAGIYQWNGGYQSDANGSLLSNELKAPDEGNTASPGTSSIATYPFWNQNGTNCMGDFNVTMVPTPGGNGVAEKGPKNKLNPWGVELTSVRYDSFPDNTNIQPDPCVGSPGCPRESAPSECQLTPGSMTNNGSTAIDINITKNAPGAQYYNVYLNVNGCDGIQTNFGFYGRFLAPGFKDAGGVPPVGGANPYLGGNPPAGPDGSLTNPYPSPTQVTLGYTTLSPAGFASIMNFNHLGILYTPVHCPSLSRVQGCQPPDVEQPAQCFQNCPPPPGTPLSQENASTLLQYSPYTGGDVANENYCVTQAASGGDPNAPCFGATITPGAVQFYLPAGSCMTQNATGATYVFSGRQYNWIVIYAPASNNCSDTLNGGSSTQYIGTIYTPGANWTLNGGNRAPLAGQVICNTAFVAGGATVGIDYNPNYAPAPPAARLIA